MWYAWFVQHVALPNAQIFSYMVAYGEFLVGVALILGFLTGVSIFFGMFMNLHQPDLVSAGLRPALCVARVGLYRVGPLRIADCKQIIAPKKYIK